MIISKEHIIKLIHIFSNWPHQPRFLLQFLQDYNPLRQRTGFEVFRTILMQEQWFLESINILVPPNIDHTQKSMGFEMIETPLMSFRSKNRGILALLKIWISFCVGFVEGNAWAVLTRNLRSKVPQNQFRALVDYFRVRIVVMMGLILKIYAIIW